MLEGELAHLLMALMDRQKTTFMRVVSLHDLSPPQFQALRRLHLEGSMPMSDLADRMACDASNVTGISDRLEARGLVTRQPHPHDRRVKTLVLTPEGEKVAQAVFADLVENGWAHDLEPDERIAMRDLLRKVVGTDHPYADPIVQQGG